MRKNILAMLLVSVALAGCDTLTRIALEKASDSRIRYGSHCETLRMQCPEGDYSEWETLEGKRGCSCAGESSQSRAPRDFQDPV